MVIDWIKFLRKIDKNVSIKIYNTIELILEWNFDGLDIKPIIWRKWFYRCRVWDIRIIFINIRWNISIYKIWFRWDIYNKI